MRFIALACSIILLACKNKDVSHSDSGNLTGISPESSKSYHLANQRSATNSWLLKSSLSLVLGIESPTLKIKTFLEMLKEKLEALQYGADIPNIDENDALDPSPSFKSHFYDYKTGTNYLGETSPTALEKVLEHTTGANTAFAKGDLDTTVNQLGRAVHFLVDSCNPHHATNRIARLSFHSLYEEYVANQLNTDGSKYLASAFKPVVYAEYKDLVLKCATSAATLIALADAGKDCDPGTSSQAGANMGIEASSPLASKCPNYDEWNKAMQAQMQLTQDIIAQYFYKFAAEIEQTSK